LGQAEAQLQTIEATSSRYFCAMTLKSSCNAGIKTWTHAFALEAAQMEEVAREQVQAWFERAMEDEGILECLRKRTREPFVLRNTLVRLDDGRWRSS